MGRKKILDGTSHAVDSYELKPFCYYCDREFDTVKTLIQHQRTKHLACSECGLKFDTVTGLRVHMLNAYKKTMKEVPGAIAGRGNPDIVVHGMEGIPKSVIEEKTKKAQDERAEKEKARAEKERAERPAAPPEPPPATSSSSPPRPPPEQKPAKAKVEAPMPPVGDRSAPAPPALPPAPVFPVPVVAPTPLPVVPAPVAPVQPVAAEQPQGMMASLSPAVQKLLSGGTGPPDSDKAVAVAGLPGRTVPERLSGLHPVALQVLATAGVLPVGAGGTSGAPPKVFSEKRPAPMSMTEPLAGSLLSVGAFPPVGFQPAGFAPLTAPLPPMLSGTMGVPGVQVAPFGMDAKRPRLEGLGMLLPIGPSP